MVDLIRKTLGDTGEGVTVAPHSRQAAILQFFPKEKRPDIPLGVPLFGVQMPKLLPSDACVPFAQQPTQLHGLFALWSSCWALASRVHQRLQRRPEQY